MTKWRALAIPLITLLSLVLTSAQPIFAGEGYATWYGQPYHGRRMANGQVFDMYDPTTTASNEFPFGTWLRVTNPSNGQSIEVEVRDRGGFGHALDLSYAAFAKLAPPSVSRIFVHYEVIPGPGQPPAPPPPTETAAPTPSVAAAPPEPPRVASPAPSPAPAVYVVQAGETLASIASRFDLSAADLARWNGLSNPDLIQEGQELTLRPPSGSSAAGRPQATEAGGETYIVQAGDVLWRIAERFGVAPDALARANDLGPDAVLRIGQPLTIPNGAMYYVVQPGDTLATIAEQFDTTIEALLGLNHLDDPDHLAIGERLRVH